MRGECVMGIRDLLGWPGDGYTGVARLDTAESQCLRLLTAVHGDDELGGDRDVGTPGGRITWCPPTSSKRDIKETR